MTFRPEFRPQWSSESHVTVLILNRLDAGDTADFAMVCLWLLFAVVLFVAEPLILHRWFHGRASATPDTAFAFLHRVHWLLLVLSLITILGAVAGSQGTSLF